MCEACPAPTRADGGHVKAGPRFRFVLCRPKTSENIGFVCRAVKTMGFSELAIVGDEATEDGVVVRATAVHAADIYDRVLRFPDVRAAVADCALVAGTTRRRGKGRKRVIVLPEELAARADGIDGTVAILFGNEESGLSSDELSACSFAVTIPTDRAFPSLNLSHAVQIIAYVLRRHEWRNPTYTPVTSARVSDAVESIVSELARIELFPASGPSSTHDLLLDVLGRAGLTEGELRDLERLFVRIGRRRQ